MKTLCIGVAGGTGSGKTTVADEIVRRVGSERIVTVNQDRYYHDLAHLDDGERAHHNFDHPEAIEDRILVEHLLLLKSGQPAPLPCYDFSRHVRLTATEWAEPQTVILLEGILILAIPKIRELLDVKIFVDTDPDIRFIRRLKRDLVERHRSVESVVEQYVSDGSSNASGVRRTLEALGGRHHSGGRIQYGRARSCDQPNPADAAGMSMAVRYAG